MIPTQAFPGMEFLPLMVLTTIAGAVSASVGIFAGLASPSSRVARVAGWTAIGLSLVPTLFYVLLTFGNVFLVAYLITIQPAIPGALAVALSRRSKWPYERKLRGITIIMTVVVVGSIFTLGVLAGLRTMAGDKRLEGLLAGKPVSPLVGFSIENQQREVYCSDPESLRYLAKLFSRAEHTLDGIDGASYDLTLRFEDGYEKRVSTTWGTDGLTLSVGRRAESEGWPTHRVSFDVSVPSQFEQLNDFLAAPYEEVAGQVLSIRAEGSTINYKASLDLRERE